MAVNTETSSLERTVGADSSDGDVLGNSVTSKIAFYGYTPIVQRSGASQAAVDTTAATSTTPHGFSSTQANAIVTLVNEMRDTLVALGLFKGSA